MVKGWIGEPPLALSIEADSMQLQLEEVVAITCRIKHDVRGFIDLQNVFRLECRMRRQGRDQATAEIVQVEIRPAVARRLPDESFAVFQKIDRRVVLDPAGRPLFMN